mmetsp:Transcript_35465/g.105896  ORF Transcript_35465/g.105896 Transcript_35465/m.105896 type:complete len:612 (-) Transcript_35465:275-2110(-)
MSNPHHSRGGGGKRPATLETLHGSVEEMKPPIVAAIAVPINNADADANPSSYPTRASAAVPMAAAIAASPPEAPSVAGTKYLVGEDDGCCPTCGTPTHRIKTSKGWFGGRRTEKMPLFIDGQVKGGKCLLCPDGPNAGKSVAFACHIPDPQGKEVIENSTVKQVLQIFDNILSLAREHSRNQSSIAAVGGLQALASAGMVDEKRTPAKGDTDIQILAQKHVANESAIAAAGGIPAVILAMERNMHEPTVQHTGCKILLNLMAGSPQKRQEVTREGGVKVAISAMQNHEHSIVVQENAISMLGDVVFYLRAQTYVADAGGVAAVVTAMRTHEQSPIIQNFGCLALSNFIAGPQNHDSIVKAGCIPLALGIMKKYRNVPRLQESTFILLKNLCSTGKYKTVIANAGAIPEIIMAMRLYPGLGSLQKQGCWALRNLARNCRKNRIEVVRKGGVRSVLVAMKSHFNSTVVQEHGCFALQMVFKEKWLTEEVALSDGEIIEAVIHAMDLCQRLHSVQIAGCGLFSFLSEGRGDVPKIIVAKGGTSQVVSAMKRFPSLEGVQRNACLCLRELSKRQDNVPVMQKEQAGYYLALAAENFPSTCGRSSQKALRDLGMMK